MKLPSLQYYCINHERKSDKCKIILSISWEGNRIIYYSGITVKNFQWNRQRREFQNIENKDALNSGLDSFKNLVVNLHRSLSIRYGKVTRRHFKDELDRLKINPGYNLSEAFVKFISENEKTWSKNTFLKSRSFYSYLDRFIDLYQPFCSLETVDRNFLEAFDNFLMREGLGFNSRYSYLNLFKWFLSWAKKENMLINDSYRNFSLAGIRRENRRDVSPPYLEREELLKMYHSAPGKRKLEHCRDIYCFMAFTGCSLDEMNDLKSKHFDEEGIQIPGRNLRSIPLNKYTREIIDRYHNKYYKGGSFFPVYTKMTFNKYVRELSVFLNFDRKVTIRRRGKIVKIPLQEAITINSAKWTFYANAISLGLPQEVVQKWAGTKSTGSYKRILRDLGQLEKKSLALINRNYEDTL